MAIQFIRKQSIKKKMFIMSWKLYINIYYVIDYTITLVAGVIA